MQAGSLQRTLGPSTGLSASHSRGAEKKRPRELRAIALKLYRKCRTTSGLQCWKRSHSPEATSCFRGKKKSPQPFIRPCFRTRSCSEETADLWSEDGPSGQVLKLASDMTSASAGADVTLRREGILWRRVVLVVVALLLLFGRRPASAFAKAVVGGGGAEATGAAFKFGAFGLQGSLTDRTPGLAYFALLMAAGCGLFVSEEALNVWVGGSLGRCLLLDSTREALMGSLRANGGYIASVIFWVYWGVCLSDLIPFYAGKWAADRGEKVTEKLGGTNQATLARVTATVRKYGAYIGLVERFSLGVRNPTAFLAGFSGVSTPTFFIGVCAGALITLPLQMGLGFVLRDRPIAALATVAAVVGTWTVIPYASATLAATWFFLKQRLDKNKEANNQE